MEYQHEDVTSRSALDMNGDERTEIGLCCFECGRRTENLRLKTIKGEDRLICGCTGGFYGTKSVGSRNFARV